MQNRSWHRSPHHRQPNRSEDLETRRRRALRRRQRSRLLGPGPSRFWSEGLSVGTEGVRRPEPGSEGTQARDAGAAWRGLGRAGEKEGGRSHRPHQAGRGPPSPAARAGADRGRPGGALHGGPRLGELQRPHRGHIPGVARQPYPPGAGNDAGCCGRTFGGVGAALRASPYAPGGEPGSHGAFQDVLARRGLGSGPGGEQSLPLRGQVQGRKARAVPDPGGIPAGGTGNCACWRRRESFRPVQSPRCVY